jgi:hypothetical protein
MSASFYLLISSGKLAAIHTPAEAKVLVDARRSVYNRIRPDSSLGYRPPAPEVHLVGKLTLGPVQS